MYLIRENAKSEKSKHRQLLIIEKIRLQKFAHRVLVNIDTILLRFDSCIKCSSSQYKFRFESAESISLTQYAKTNCVQSKN